MMRYWLCWLMVAAAILYGCDATAPDVMEPPSTPPPSPSPSPVPPPPTDPRPNIILIMADDLGYETLGVNGSASYQTPHLNALAQGGMRFTQAYSTPQCTTTRVQLMTGKYNFRNYIGFGLLDPSERTFAHRLKDAGYRTAIVGKWQLFGTAEQRGNAGRDGSLPEQAGFDEYVLWQIDETGSRFKDPLLYINSLIPEVHEGAYGPDVFVSYIEDFLERGHDRPFFLYYPMVFTHRPHQPTPDHPDYPTFDAGNTDPVYFQDNVAYMDQLIGRIIQQLDRLGLRQNTLVLFTGDNGTPQSVTSVLNGRLIQGGKGKTTEAGTHVPLIANWPGPIAAGQVNDNLIDFTDVLPTLMDLAETPLNDETDGLSFYGQLMGQADSVRSWIFCHFDPHLDGSRRYAQDAEWKLYENDRFFHIATDPEEEQRMTEEELSEDALARKQHLRAVLDRLR